MRRGYWQLATFVLTPKTHPRNTLIGHHGSRPLYYRIITSFELPVAVPLETTFSVRTPIVSSICPDSLASSKTRRPKQSRPGPRAHGPGHGCWLIYPTAKCNALVRKE